MAIKKELTQAILHQLVLYHPTTGVFTKPDGGHINQGCGRVYIPKYGAYSAHRLAFLFMEGSWPEALVDHIDGNTLNNAWTNLRRATHSQNMQNRQAKSTNKSGLLGVRKHGKKHIATITLEGVKTELGRFSSAEEAHEVYVKVKRELHPFGEL